MDNKYITPKLIRSSSIEGIKQYANNSKKNYWLNDEKVLFSEVQLSDLDSNNNIILLGEPGCGKSEFTNQIKENKLFAEKQTIVFNLNEYKNENSFSISDVSSETILCFDALDEVNPNLFPLVVRYISSLAAKYPDNKIIVTCRTYYIEDNLLLIQNQLSGFNYVLIDFFDDNQIERFLKIQIRQKEIQDSLINKLATEQGNALKAIFRIPRYLTEICNVINNNSINIENITNWKRTDFLDKAIYSQLDSETKKEGEKAIPNEKELSQRVLEKIALVMEIKRTNQITKDELITILDDINSNINLAFLSSFDISLFLNRTMKQTGNIIEFHNTEFQEYLAAKEILRMKSIDQVLFDLILDHELRHIYNNWYDVLRYIVELKPELLVPLANFLSSKRDGLADDQLLRLLKEADTSALSKREKAILFDLYYSYFLSHNQYVHGYTELIVSLFTDDNKLHFHTVVPESSRVSYNYRIYNQSHIISCSIKQGLFNADFSDKWKKIFFDIATTHEDTSAQQAAIYALREIKASEELLEIKESGAILSENPAYKVLLSALGSVCPDQSVVIEELLQGVELGYKDAVYGLMNISEIDVFIDVFTRVVNDEQLYSNFFDHDLYIYGYYGLSNNIRDFWHLDERIGQIAFKLLEKLLTDETYKYDHTIRDFVEQLLFDLKSQSDQHIFQCIDIFKDTWKIHYNIWILQTMILPGQLGRIKEHIDAKKDTIDGDEICTNILQSIKNEKVHNQDKDAIYEEGRSIYTSHYEKWENPDSPIDTDAASLKAYVDLISEIQSIDVTKNYWYWNLVSILLNNGIKSDLFNYEEHKDIIDKIKEAIKLTINEFDINNLTVNRSEGNSFTIFPRHYFHFSKYVDLGIEFDLEEEIKTKFREKLLHFLPLSFSNINSIKEISEKIIGLIGEITKEEENMLYELYNQRNDDYIILFPQTLFSVIEHFKLKSFAAIVERFVSVDYEDNFYATQALDLLAKDFIKKEEPFFEEIFNRISPDVIEKNTLQELANQYLIFLYNNSNAVKWRFEYLKKNVYEFTLYDFEGTRGVSSEEAEMDRPTFCNCLITSGCKDYIDNFIDLIDFSLTISTEKKYWKYSEYLQTMSLAYFKQLNKKDCLFDIRRITNTHTNQFAVERFNPLLRDAELHILNNEDALNIQFAVDKYNSVKNKQYALIYNETDLFYKVKTAIDQLKNIIENEGLYRPITELSGGSHINEDLVQKTLKLALENALYKMGIRDIDIDREVNLYDNKRTDILVKYGFIGPILFELKLLHNEEILKTDEREKYKIKLKQYINGNYSKYTFYLIFQVKTESVSKNHSQHFEALKNEYSDIENLYPM